jgi:hypothetical protein
MILLLAILLPLGLMVYFGISYIFSYYIFYDFFPHWLEYLIETFPGKWFIPYDLSLDSIVNLSNSLGDVIGVISACLFVSIATSMWERAVERRG